MIFFLEASLADLSAADFSPSLLSSFLGDAGFFIEAPCLDAVAETRGNIRTWSRAGTDNKTEQTHPEVLKILDLWCLLWTLQEKLLRSSL